MSDTIVVTGQRIQTSDGTPSILYSSSTSGEVGTSYQTTRQVDEQGGSGEQALTVGVKIEKTKSETDQAKLTQAAQQLIKAIIEMTEALQLADPNGIITSVGRMMTVGEMLDTLMNTQFTVTDRTDFNNNGVGSAQRGTDGGPNIDIINYEAIVGGPGGIGYGDASYPENSGMYALVLHEAAHMTAAGAEFFKRSVEVARADATVGGQFYGTEYATNLEAFANSFMTRTSNAAGVNLFGIRPGSSADPVSPESIYQAHTGSAFTG